MRKLNQIGKVFRSTDPPEAIEPEEDDKIEIPPVIND